MTRPCILLPLALAAIPCAALAQGETVHYIDERTGLDAWKWEVPDFSLTLIQRLPDQTRAFFLGRGFSRDAVDRLAANCVFQTIAGNPAGPDGGTVSLDLREWRFDGGAGQLPLRLKEDWAAEWQAMQESMPAQVAFRWSFFPTEQHFRPADWNMGMTSFPVSPGTTLDVHFSWSHHDETRHGVLRGVRCARDVDLKERGNTQ